ncbi:MAG: GNAT family N-acetyltransferase [Methanomassiliicoccales archaeon]|jgi:ribosomal protein S18 acetylase RimI-like enzyme
MRIRPAGVEDLPHMLVVEKGCFGSERFDLRTLEDILNDEEDESFTMEDEGGIVGSLMIQHKVSLGRSRIISLAVMPEHRGKGYGRAALEFLEDRARSKRSTIMELEVRVINVAAIDLYLTSRYEILGTIPSYFGRGEDALYMEKVL